MDKNIECKDCGKTFILSKSEQDFYKKKGLYEPKRCQSCREAKKLNQNHANH